ncbi:hypothetical protein CVT25_004332 [Psilocybe cyanescens]|uniref:Uncharacterized protein n=1 Tax=Psilocybe cyanescens TaxID=93625 RepID=A0A409XQ55_PSICY|nr:hypothetical protein CVT25_004332 [Psilocybe cyanescens]
MNHELNGEGGENGHVAAKTTSIAKVVNIVDPMFNSSTIGTAIQVLESLSEVGKELPFIAPAFILLKIIIDVEKRAQDADAKCNDLVERVTFMLSHLPALKDVKILAATREFIVKRVEEVLKDATALILTYRKQSRVARRLNMSNRDRFSACADGINGCCRDLLMSLQIHQTVQMEILTRGVPADAGDIAGGAYIADHGGDDAVLHNEELVSEFARQQHLAMDDSVMEQLNASIADSVKENHERLEGILRENVNSAIIHGLKDIAMGLYASENEQKFHCVQCNQNFTKSTNGSTACSFHRGEYNTWSQKHPCCSNAHPCQFGIHRENHHCDYPYELFFSYAAALTKEEWTNVEDRNLQTDNVQKAFVGQLLRSTSTGGRIGENTLLIIVGTVHYEHPYYLNTFTAKELEDTSKSVELTHSTLIFRTSKDEADYALAEWSLDASGKISGIQIKAKASTSTEPWVRVCPIDITTCQKSGDILTISEGGMWSYTPSTEYDLPQTVTFGPAVRDTPSRPVRTNFKSRTTPSFRVILKSASDPPLTHNRMMFSANEFFRGKVSVFNNNLAGSLNPVTIASVSAFYRMVGDAEYAAVKALNGIDVLPVTIEPRQPWLLDFEVVVPRSEEEAKNDWLMARHRPLRIKLVVEDIEGEQCSLVIEYVHKPFLFQTRSETDSAFFFFDDPQSLDRTCVHVRPSEDPLHVIVIGGSYISIRHLETLVYQALQSEQTEHEMTQFAQRSSFGEWEWTVMALVDLSCRRVYAFKIIMQEGPKFPVKRLGCIGYVPCPRYGRVVEERRPISYATELAKLPPLEPYNLPEYPQDDTLDDVDIPAQPNLTAPVSSNDGAVISADLVNRLTSIDTNLTRIAAVLEQDLANRSTFYANLARIATAMENMNAVKLGSPSF